MDILLKDKHGIIISCDFSNIEKLEKLVKETCSLDFIQGYKIGMALAVKNSMRTVTDAIRKYSNLPIIYDHQKFGTDTAEICSGEILQIIKNAGVNALVVFPLAGIETLKLIIKECFKVGLVPIVGGDMAHVGYTAIEGGYIDESAAQRIYIDAATVGVTHFILPCSKLERIKIYMHKLGNIVGNPKIFLAGIKEEINEELLEACRIIHSYNSYAIIGRGITEDKDYKTAANKFWKVVQERTKS
ncbi:MAG: orotidine 5'-phosphate decarboxylase / HUMPS family protein [Candidatus Humimicrobiaceae bacterium]